MKYYNLCISRSKQIKVLEKNERIVIYEGISKRMPTVLLNRIIQEDVLKSEEVGGRLIVVLDYGKTIEELNESKQHRTDGLKRRLNPLFLTTSLMMASLGQWMPYR